VSETLPYFDDKVSEILAADMYSRYVTEHLTKDLESRNTLGSLDSCITNIAQLAEYMIVNNEYRLHHSKVIENILHADPNEAQQFLTSSFLLRDTNGVYEFSHKSFMEYFAALRMFMDIRESRLSSPIWRNVSSCAWQQLEFFNEMVESHWREYTVDKISKDCFLELPNGRLIQREPVSYHQYSTFLDETGYQPLSRVAQRLGYAEVSWYDAVAYAIWAGARIQRVQELVALLESEFPHSSLSIGETPSDSVFSVSGNNWERVVRSSTSMIFLRGFREWAWPIRQVGGGWLFSGDKRTITTFNAGSGSISFFRCVSRTSG